MPSTTLHIKNMVCNRCIRVVEEELRGAGYDVQEIELGKAVLAHEEPELERGRIAGILSDSGFELIEDQKKQLVDAVKTAIINTIHHEDIADRRIVWSDYLTEITNNEYKYVSRLFSSLEGITIEQYVIRQKIEKVKELIVYNDLSLSEIAFRLGYSSASHLSTQFKKITGMSPKEFRELGMNHRKPLDQV